MNEVMKDKPVVLLSIQQVAERCGLSVSMIRKLIRQDRFVPAVDLGVNKLLFTEDSIDAFLNERIKLKRKQQ